MDNSRNRKLGSILSYTQMFLSIIISLSYTPIMIRILGKNEYGLYQTALSTISMLNILSLGFHSGYIRFYSGYRKRNDQEAIFRLNGLYLLVFLGVGVVAFACGIYLSCHGELLFNKGLTREEYALVRKLLMILSVNMAFYFPASVFDTILSAQEKFVFQKVVSIIGTLLSPLVSLPLLLTGFRSLAIVTVSVAISMLTQLLNFYMVGCRMKQKFYFSGFPKGLMKNLIAFTGFIALEVIISQINLNVDKLLLARFRGTAQVAVYSVGMSMYNYFVEFSSSVSFVFTPKIHAVYNQYKQDVRRRNEELTGLFINVGRIQFLLLGLVGSGLILWGREFIGFWVGDGYENAYWVALLLTIPASIELIQRLGIEIQRAMNKHSFRSFILTLMAAGNVGMTIVLCRRYGAVGAAFGTAVAMILGNGMIINIYYYKKCGINIPVFWKNIGMQARGLVIPAALGIALKCYLPVKSVWMLLGQIVLYTLVYAASMWMLGMNGFEKDLVAGMVKKLLCRNETAGEKEEGGEEI